MFVIRDTKSIKWPVTVEVGTDGGKTTKSIFTGEFRKLSATESDEVLEQLQTEEAGASNNGPRLAEVMARNAAYFSNILIGWEGIKDEHGQEVTFSREILSAVLLSPDGFAFVNALNRAVSEIRAGARQKN